MKKAILVVEDEPHIADTIVYAVEKEGFAAQWVSTGREALQLITTQSFAALIFDVGLPDMSGFDLCRDIRKTQSTPILFLTARADEIDRVVGLEIGGDDYLTKPFSPRELGARIKAILRRTESTTSVTSAATITVSSSPFKIDEDRRQIDYFGQRLELSRYEYNLLKVFMARPGKVFSRDDLMNRAWDAPESSLDRTVDAHIKRLRSELKKIRPDLDPIETHRGVGYSLKDTW